MQKAIYAFVITAMIFATCLLLVLYTMKTDVAQGASSSDPLIVTRATTATSTSITTTSVRVFATSTSRVYAKLCNDSNNPMFINFGVHAVVDAGIRISPGTCFDIGGNQPLFRGALHAIASSTGPMSWIDVSGTQGTFGN